MVHYSSVMPKAPYLRIRVPASQATAAGIVTAVESELDSGAVAAGSRLPPVRVLAHQLGVSKTTVSTAYDELDARGLLERQERRGVFLKPPLEKRATIVQASRPTLRPEVRPTPGPVGVQLSNVFVDSRLLPTQALTRCYRAVLKRGLEPFYEAQGYLPLRQAIAKRLVQRGFETSAEEILITVGSQQALDVICRALSARRIATENPAYSIGKQLFEMNQMEVIGLPLDPFSDLPLEEWEAVLRRHRPAMLYLTTNFQNPTGYSYSTSELRRLAELSSELGFGVIEDDWGSDMLSYSEYRPPLRALAGPEVLYMNSFTKKLMPSMRLGYLVAHRELMPTLVAAKRVATLANPWLEEAALAEFLTRGYYDRHLKSLQKELDNRYRNCLRLLRDLMPEGVRWSQPGGGPLVWLECPKSVELSKLQEELAQRQVCIGIQPERFFGTPHLHGFPLGFASMNCDEFESGLRILANCLETSLCLQR